MCRGSRQRGGGAAGIALLERLDESERGLLRGSFIVALEQQLDEAREGRIAHRFSQGDLFLIKAFIVLMDAALDGVVLRIVRLHEDVAAFAVRRVAACPTGGLRD